MTGKLIPELAQVVGIYDVSEHDEYSLQMMMDGPEADDWDLDTFDEPGKYVMIRVDD
jgi:hypothetical protein